MRPLMDCRESEQVRGWLCRQHRSLGGPAQRRQVVHARRRRRLHYVRFVDKDVVVPYDTCKLEL